MTLEELIIELVGKGVSVTFDVTEDGYYVELVHIHTGVLALGPERDTLLDALISAKEKAGL